MDPTPSSLSSYYYVSPQGETRGPITLLALQALLNARTPDVSESTLVWTQGIDNWMPLGKVLALGGNSTESRLEATAAKDKDSGDNDSHSRSKEQDSKQKQPQKKKPGNATCSIYIEGLPKDVTEDELAQFFSRCGLIKRDNTKPRVKLYRDHDTGQPKGDALVTYVAPESVFLAIQRYDEADFRDGHILSVKEAEFSSSSTAPGTTAPTNAEKRPKGGADDKTIRAKKVRRMQERAMLSWNEDSFATKEAALLIVVLKGMFNPDELAKGGATAYSELEQDLIEGLAPICPTGDEIKKITVFKSHPEAVILIRFKDAIVAGECVQLMNGRYFDGRKIEAALWDGVTEYAPREDVEAKLDEQQKRMEAYDEWLEGEEQDM